MYVLLGRYFLAGCLLILFVQGYLLLFKEAKKEENWPKIILLAIFLLLFCSVLAGALIYWHN
jgi:NhaP-type Na+/H+ or K+/H+ antiporter